MSRTSHPLAKIIRPRLYNAVPRDRLFSRIDDLRNQKPALCVVGPPGAGKTTLVASWLDARKAPGIWYQVDAGDADLATFFYYLGEAARPFLRKERALPLLTPEYQHDVTGFSRRYFRDLFRLLPDGAVIVLDNYQEVDAAHPFHVQMAEAASEVPDGRFLLVISRRDPPDCYARLRANQNVALLDWEDIRLDLDETTMLARTRLPSIEGSAIHDLHEHCGGWAAGLTLMLDEYERTRTALPRATMHPEAVFSYFTSQILDHLPATTRTFLALTAVFPQVTVQMARQLTGNEDAASILDDLYRRKLFTHRRPGHEPVYWYHALFRTFLLGMAEQTLGAEQLLTSRRRAARLLDAQGEHEQAFQISCETQDWSAAVRLIERHAQTMLAKGRGLTLREWISSLPLDVLERSPWVRYWLGVALNPLDQVGARVPLELAFEQFQALGDAPGQGLTAAALIESYLFEWHDFRPMRRWVDTLMPLLQTRTALNSQQVESKILPNLLVGMLYAAPAHSMLTATVARVTEMLDENLETNSMAAVAINLLSYCNITCDMARARIAAHRMETLLQSPDLTPFNRLWCLVRLGYYYSLTGVYQKGREALSEAASIGETHGLRGLRRSFLLIANYQINTHLMTHDLRGARSWNQRIRAMADPGRAVDAFTVSYSQTLLDCASGHYAPLIEGVARDLESAASTGMIYLEVLRMEQEAQGCALLGQYARMHEALSRLRHRIAGSCFAHYECQAQFIEIYAMLMQGDEAGARAMLGGAMALVRQSDFPFPQMARFSGTAGVVLAQALRCGIEPHLARELIGRLQIKPPPGVTQHWPWPIKILSLGRFEILCDESTVEFSRRAPRKVLSVLRHIIAGDGDAVPVSRLMDSLWPDEEGDAARKSLDVALVRLRRLLGSAESIIVRDEQVLLNRHLCWVDAWAFATEVRRITADKPTRNDALASAGLAVLQLYRGAFLPSVQDDPQVIIRRLKLREQLSRLVASLGRALEDSGQIESALDCYQQGIEADELVEEFYQGAARCHLAAGRNAEAMATMRRLRQTLSVVLGIGLSRSSEELLKSIGQ